MSTRELLAIEKELLLAFADIRDEKMTVRDVFLFSCEKLGFDSVELSDWEVMSDDEVSSLPGSTKTFAKYVRAGLVIADKASEGTQPAYHNSRHTAESMVSAVVLAQDEFSEEPSKIKLQGLRLLVAMTGHDIFHDGRTNAARKKWMEVISANETGDVLEAFGLSDGEKRLINEIIIGTEVEENVVVNREVYEESEVEGEIHAKDALKVLANDADILASVLPITGPTRGRLYSEELKSSKTVGWETPGSWKGRLDFLANAKLVSQASRRLGFRQLQDEEIAVLEKLVAGDESSPPLDSLPYPEARVSVLKSLGYKPEMRMSDRPAVERGPEASMDGETRQLKLF